MLADRNLLFGILALQMDFITRDGLIRGINAWVLNKQRPLGQVLVEEGELHADARAALEMVVEQHLKQHGDDPHRSLAAITLPGSLPPELEQVADADIAARLAEVTATQHVESVPCVTTDFMGGAPTAAGRRTAARTPTSTGPRFRVLRPHAKGGLGEVFVAYDEELHREVALKAIQAPYADDRYSRARFLLEAKVTGGLEHPGVVPVYALGMHADGRPFYAMRFIQGHSLHEAIQQFHAADMPGRRPGERALALRQLLGRFVAVCNTVAYAHSRGVIHRDLKPANVMLGSFGETLVVDWGISKVVGRPAAADGAKGAALSPSSADNTALTQVGAAVGTPAYMSPEQAAGKVDQLGPPSDIYSLGATLYCLLTGNAPFQGRSVAAMLRKAQKGELPPPRQIKRDVPPALEAVCRKAMALRPEDRYATAHALAADIEQWLADEPVSAWREPVRVRAGRWAQRHQASVAAAAAGLLVMVLAGGAGLWWLDRQHTEQRQALEKVLDKVAGLQGQAHWEEAAALLEQENDRLGRGRAPDLRARLERARRELHLVKRLDAVRLQRATGFTGRVEMPEADHEYEDVFRSAGMVEAFGDSEAAAAWVRESAVRDALIAALDDWASCASGQERRAWLLGVARRADPDPWRDAVRDPVAWENGAILAQRVTGEPVAKQSPQLLAALGMRLHGLEVDARPVLQAAQEKYPGDFWVNFALARALQRANNKAEAIGYYRAALVVRPGVYALHNNLGTILEEQGKPAEAVTELRKAIELNPKLAAGHINLGNALRRQGKLSEAIAEFRTATELGPHIAVAHTNLGNALRDQGKPAEAIAELRKASELGPQDAGAHYNLGLVLRNEGNLDEAAAELRKALELLPSADPFRKVVTERLQECERMQTLERKLEAIFRKEAQPADAAEQVALARLCIGKKRYATAAQFFADGLRGRPDLADDLRSFNRYDAACCAALASARQGEDAGELDNRERSRLRQQALGWLRADLALWGKQVESGTRQVRATVREKLHQWQMDSDLSGVRDAALLEKLPESERAEWAKLWADVEALSRRSQGK
jgi:tetratricopeptide (TPR) repeat protein/tRNA A-37 threonylcarbamoyl transferase component Bud32